MFRHYGYFTLQDDESRQQNSQFGAAPQRDPRPQDPVWTSPAQITFYFSVFYVWVFWDWLHVVLKITEGQRQSVYFDYNDIKCILIFILMLLFPGLRG